MNRVGRRTTMTRFTLTAFLVLTGMTFVAEAAESNKPAPAANCDRVKEFLL